MRVAAAPKRALIKRPKEFRDIRGFAQSDRLKPTQGEVTRQQPSEPTIGNTPIDTFRNKASSYVVIKIANHRLANWTPSEASCYAKAAKAGKLYRGTSQVESNDGAQKVEFKALHPTQRQADVTRER